jgi:REP element-mobilizing transposase RayT
VQESLEGTTNPGLNNPPPHTSPGQGRHMKLCHASHPDIPFRSKFNHIQTAPDRFIMPDTYTQLYIHVVFAVSSRQALIKPHFSSEIQRYITGIVKNKGSRLLAIKAMPDHVHILLALDPKTSISDLMREVKASSSGFMKKKFNLSLFSWQSGYGAFSYSKSQIDSVIKYILNQEEHHRQKSFKEEYMKILVDFGVEYDEKYLFHWIYEEEDASD